MEEELLSRRTSSWRNLVARLLMQPVGYIVILSQEVKTKFKLLVFHYTRVEDNFNYWIYLQFHKSIWNKKYELQQQLEARYLLRYQTFFELNAVGCITIYFYCSSNIDDKS